jgi:LCP family protein required for cell wall assembly
MDIIVAKQAKKFPGVGMTLPHTQYKYGGAQSRRAGKPQSASAAVAGRQAFWRKITLKRAVITLFILVMLVGGFVAGKFIWNAHKLFGGSILGVLHSTKLKGENEGRVNILLAGNSADDPGHGGANLTDSIMILSLDTRNNKAFMLSVPRDLWVKVPGDGHNKINQVYVQGEEEKFNETGYAPGGMGLLEKVISQDFDMPIHYYALIDYNALKQSVDAVGGVDFTVKSSDPRGLYDPNIDWTTHGPLVKLTNGVHHLSGQQALDLARARGDAYNSYGFAASDFDRTEHQRQLLVALKNKATSPGVIANPAKLGSLSDAVGNNVKTDFKSDEVRRLYDLSKKVSNNNIKSLSLNNADGKNLLESYNANGQSALIPAKDLDDFTDIQAFVRRQTSSDPIVQESAKVVVLNGTEVNGLAIQWKNKLTARNFVIEDVGDSTPKGQTAATIVDLSEGKKPATKAALIKQFGNGLTTQSKYARAYPDADFIVVLGTQQTPQTAGSKP